MHVVKCVFMQKKRLLATIVLLISLVSFTGCKKKHEQSENELKAKATEAKIRLENLLSDYTLAQEELQRAKKDYEKAHNLLQAQIHRNTNTHPSDDSNQITPEEASGLLSAGMSILSEQQASLTKSVAAWKKQAEDYRIKYYNVSKQ